MISSAPTCEFSLLHYREICDLLKARAYRFLSFEEVDEGAAARAALMRHDVDQSLEAAVRLSKLEQELGVRSTYFVRLTGPFYNCFDPVQKGMIQSLAAAGHWVGLHFDPTVYPGASPGELGVLAARECETFGSALGAPPRVVSLHRPTPQAMSDDFLPPGYLNAYSAKFTKGFEYMSDSGRFWREGCVCRKLVANTAPDRLQILTHAFWWVSPENTIRDRVQEFLNEKRVYLDESMARNIKGYSAGS